MKSYIESNHSRPVHTFPALYMARSSGTSSSVYDGMVVLATNRTTGTVVVPPPSQKNPWLKYPIGFHCQDWADFDDATEWVPLYGKVVIDTTDK